MRNIIKCILISTVFSATRALPVSQPIYTNAQYVSAQAVPQITYKQPAAQGYLQTQYARPQYAQVPQVTPVYERSRDGLQSYASQGQGQPLQQVQKLANVGSPYYLNHVQNAQLAAQAQEAFAAAQRKASSQNFIKQIQPAPVVHQPQPTQQPQQYVREQPQHIRYVPRTSAPQYKAQQQVQQAREDEKEDYDPNPSYQFGFDVKDDLYTNYQNRKEQREGNKITGSYSVVDSDGFIRTVQYTADPKEGFKAEVTRQPTDIVVKIPKPDPQFQQQQRQQQQQYIQEIPAHRAQQEQRQQSNIIYQYQ